MPGGAASARCLPVDAKFPIRGLRAAHAGRMRSRRSRRRSARRGGPSRYRYPRRGAEDRAEVHLPAAQRSSYGVMFLPTEGLYAEVARIPGLIEDVGRTCIAYSSLAPSLLPALLKTIQLGYVTSYRLSKKRRGSARSALRDQGRDGEDGRRAREVGQASGQCLQHHRQPRSSPHTRHRAQTTQFGQHAGRRRPSSCWRSRPRSWRCVEDEEEA
jgi:hypothetical protein